MEPGVSPTSDRLLHVQVANDLELDGGIWTLTEDQKGLPFATITPPSVPMFRQVVAYLETKPVPPGGTSKRDDEARAAVAVCLRWGSYFGLLADSSRPDAPDIDDEQVSHIDDEEMARLNIEISAALAWWLAPTARLGALGRWAWLADATVEGRIEVEGPHGSRSTRPRVCSPVLHLPPASWKGRLPPPWTGKCGSATSKEL